MARHHDRRGRLHTPQHPPHASASIPAVPLLADVESTSAPLSSRSTPCGRRAISPARRALFFKAFAVWLLFSLGGWLSIRPEYLPIFSHCIGFGFFIVLTTHKTRWLGAILFGSVLFSTLLYYTLPPALIQTVANSFGWTAFGVTCVLVTGCTAVRQSRNTQAQTDASDDTSGTLSHSNTGERASSSSSSSSRGSFALFRDRMLEGSCGDSSIGRVYSGRYLEEYLEQRGIVTLNESTNRVTRLKLLPGAAAPSLDVASAVDTASRYFEELSAILARVGQDQAFVEFLRSAQHMAAGGEEYQEVHGEEDEHEGGEQVEEQTGPRQIHILASEGEEESSSSPSVGGDDGVASPRPPSSSPLPLSRTGSDGTSPSPSGSGPLSRASSHISDAMAASSGVPGEESADAAAFLAAASRAHLYAVIRHLNSQLLHVEESLRAARATAEREAAQRATFERTIRTLKGNLDRECAQRMQLQNEYYRSKEEERLQAKRAAKEAAHQASTGTVTGTGAAGSTAVLDSLSVADAAALKQAQAHVKDLTKKLKSLSRDHWNASHALSLASQRAKCVEEALAAATRATAERDQAAKLAQGQADAAARALRTAQEEHARAMAASTQQWQAKIKAADALRIAAERECAAKLAEQRQQHKQQQQACAAKVAKAEAAAAAETSEATPVIDDATAALIASLQSQLAEQTAVSAQSAATVTRLTRQLSVQSASLVSLSNEQATLARTVASLQCELQDARSQLTVERTIVTSLSSAAGAEGEGEGEVDFMGDGGAVWEPEDAAALAAIFDQEFSRGNDRWGEEEGQMWRGDASLTSTASAAAAAATSSSSSSASSGHSRPGSLSSSASSASSCDSDDGCSSSSSSSLLGSWARVGLEDALDPRVVAELDRQQLALAAEVANQAPAPASALVNHTARGGTGGTATVLPGRSLPQQAHTAHTSSSSSSSSSGHAWSLYSSPSQHTLSSSSTATSSSSFTPLPPSYLWSSHTRGSGAGVSLTSMPSAVGGVSGYVGSMSTSSHPPVGAEQRQVHVRSQLDALEMRIRQIKQQQQQQPHLQQQ